MTRGWPVVLVVLGMVGGCESHLERKDLERERRHLQQRQRELTETVQRESAGKSAFTQEEKARLGPAWVELRNVNARLAAIDTRLSEID